MSEHQSKLNPGQIQFHQWCEPPLEPGDYTVDVTQSVTELDAAFKNELAFSVAGPRFSLNPSEIYSVYPPKGHVGDFANALPHIVFTRRTLPWERSVHPGQRESGDKLPWMALLVFSAADFPDDKFPEITLRSIAELINPKPADPYVGPKLAVNKEKDGLAAYEKAEDLCNTIELEWGLFQKIAPSKDDLAYLAHVREVNTGNKETLSFLADGWFSVVLANRLPEPERKGVEPLAVENRAYLVSLEGMTDYLPGSKEPSPSKPVRLAVLSHWSFHCREAFAFKASMSKLGVQRLATPYLGPSAQTKAQLQVKKALQLGYTALNHSTRLGEKAVSWYRGPLVPLDLVKQSNFIFRPAADAALRYSPLDGMMDTAYAAAYQLGRLLALQDRHFAAALYGYRNRVQRQMNEVLGRKQAETIFEGASGGRESEIMRSYLKKFDPTDAKTVAKKGWATEQNVLQAEPDGYGVKTAANKGPNELNLTTDLDLTIPTSICRWLAKLVLLYRVPFANLVADERMLPPDSIRFFYLDPNWLKCLLEGACSVGRSSSRDESVDKHLRDKFLDFAMEQALEVRTRTPEAEAGASKPIASNSADTPSVITTTVPHGLTTNDRIVISEVSSPKPVKSDSEKPDINGEQTVTVIDDNTFSVPMDARAGTGGLFKTATTIDAARTPEQHQLPNWPLTGFLIRSPAVEGWQGLEMRAWKDSAGAQALDPLRIDRLAPDIMLCIFNGKVDRIEVKQPPEGMHFGATVDGDGFKRFSLRRLDDSAPGEQLEGSETPIPLRTEVKRVVDISALAEALKTKLEALSARKTTEEFTSADFGVEMVESPGRVVFDVNYKESTPR
jgi:hypothetical protein